MNRLQTSVLALLLMAAASALLVLSLATTS